MATATVRLPDSGPPVPAPDAAPITAATTRPLAVPPANRRESARDFASAQRQVGDRTRVAGQAAAGAAESPAVGPDGPVAPATLRGLFQSVGFAAQRIAQDSEPAGRAAGSPLRLAHRMAASSYAAVQAASRAAASTSREVDGLLDTGAVLAINEIV